MLTNLDIPSKNGLPVNLLAACFNSTTATYKYYWFISLLQAIEEGKKSILKNDLFAGMLSNSWFTVNYFHVSFGKQDLIQQAVIKIKETESIQIDESRSLVYQKLCASKNLETIDLLSHFNRNVPHWFLSPWFPKMPNENDSQREKRIYSESKTFSNNCLYSLYDSKIIINPEWLEYLADNSKILKDFCYWNLAKYLQLKNPNVPDIPNKLIKQELRSPLTKQRKYFWDIVVNELGSVKCIYTGNDLIIGEYAVEHFIPHAFVSHDLIWNLIPADKSFNSRKSDKLPQLEKYFSSFFNLQKQALEIVTRQSPGSKFLDEYFSLFPGMEITGQTSSSEFENKFHDVIYPLVTIASHNGFEFMQ